MKPTTNNLQIDLKVKNNLKTSLTEDEIRERAYKIWVSRNAKDKTEANDDWYAAIESLKLDRSRLKHIYCLRKKILTLLKNSNDRNFALDVIKTLISSLSLLATVIAGISLYLTYTNAKSEQSLNNERLITERFSKSIEQLGSEKLELRLGGIYALESISKNSPKNYYLPIMEIFTAFVRERSNYYWNEKGKSTTLSDKEKLVFAFPEDIQAVLKVFRRRTSSSSNGEQIIFDMSGVNLPAANLSEINFEGALFYTANLEQAYLEKANLQKTRLIKANLQDAVLKEANLRSSDLSFANLQKTNLSKANFQGADLEKTDFRNAYMCGLPFQKSACADFRGAKNLTIQQIKSARNWQEAHYDPDFNKQLGLPIKVQNNNGNSYLQNP